MHAAGARTKFACLILPSLAAAFLICSSGPAWPQTAQEYVRWCTRTMSSNFPEKRNTAAYSGRSRPSIPERSRPLIPM